MGVVTRGVRNAFRNTVRSLSVVLILAISLGLALVMLLAMRSVQSRINAVKSSIGNTITVTPAGSRGFEGGGNPLTSANVTTIQNTAHVVSTSATLSDRLDSSDTNLVSSITPGALGKRFGGGGGGGGNFGGDSQQAAPTNFTLPVEVTGTTTPLSTQVSGSNQLKITSGASFDGTKDADVALVGTALAAKNNLKVGSTFTAYGTTITVAGIYDAGNTFSNAGLIFPLPTEQRLSAQVGDVDSVIVQVDSISDLASVTSKLQSELGSAADVVSAQDTSEQALAPLENIHTISLYSLVGALVAGSVIVFLTMLMIVRERRREIGVLKAIGSSNYGIVSQFVVESLTLTIIGGFVGVILGVLLSNPILKVLVSNSSTSTTTSFGGGGGFAGGATRSVSRAFGGLRNNLSSLHAVVSYDILFYGLVAAIGIAILGSAIPAWLIAKVRPAEVMRVD